MGSIIQMSGTIAGGTENALAQIDVLKDGDLVGVCWAVILDLDADLETCSLQVSFGSTRTTANDSRQVVDNLLIQNNLTTSGQSNTGNLNQYHVMPRVPVFAGERLFLHSSATSGVTGTVLCCVHFSFNENLPSQRRRS